MADGQIQIRPPYAEKFRPAAAEALYASLDGRSPTRRTTEVARRARIADEIKVPPARRTPPLPAAGHRTHRQRAAAHHHRPPGSKLKSELELPRYKFVVQVVIGEDRGACVRMGCRCFWDAETDNYAEDTYRNVRRRAPRAATALQPQLQPDTAAIRRRPPAPRAGLALLRRGRLRSIPLLT